MVRSAFAAALCLLSASAFATPSGHKWFLSNGVPTYRVFNHSSINNISSFSTVLGPIQTSYSRWTVGSGTDRVACTSFQNMYDGTFSSPTGTSAISGNDSANRMIWLGGTSWRYGSSTLGVTTTAWYQGSGEIFDADMEMNNNIPWKLSGTGPQYDVESITTHEAGHWAGLDHTANTTAIMTPLYTQGEIKRQLTTLDVDDICNVYPQSAPAGTQGSSCTVNTDCSSTASPALRCWTTSGSTSRICSRSCTADSDCPSGLKCLQGVDSNNATGLACLAPSGAPDLCEFCTDGSQCSTGVCLSDGRHNWCSLGCSGSTQCGTDYVCSGGYCIPSSGVCNQQCTTASDCAVGYACTSGECVATGGVNDRCEVSVYCQSCLLCVGSQNEAYCRSCCGGQGQGGSCDACSSTTCPSASQCSQLQNSSGQILADSVCIPTGGDSCSPCTTGADCSQGLSCYAGRCHSTCNPGAANTCSQKACYQTGTTTGVCACSDEIAYVGQACGQTTSGLKVCANSTVCVGTPKTCRAPCTSNAECNQGEACTLVEGQNVCLPANVAGTRCSSCNNGTCSDTKDVCFNGRCRQYCNASSPSCGECVPFSGDDGVCSCSDERQAPGGACGLVANIPLSCQSGSTCNEGTCRTQCPNGQTQCLAGYACTNVGSESLCIPLGSGGGGGTSGSGGGFTGTGGGAGGGGGTLSSAGCGCGASGGTLMFALGFVGMLLRARRRK